MNFPIIDAHVHFSNIGVFHDTARLYSGVDYSAAGLQKECADAGVAQCVAMGLNETSPHSFPDKGIATPMGCDLETNPANLFTCQGINPYTIGESALARLDAELFLPNNCGIKIYAGYYPFHVYDPVYMPVYDLAAKHGKPVVIHTGDTYSEEGLLDYSHPLRVDRLAVARRDVNFILAHMGDPWLMDGAELANKNRNVYVDISGWIVGDAARIAEITAEPLLMNRFRQALIFMDDYKKIIFGTDWPLVPIAPYIEFCKALLPEKAWEYVFCKNAKEIFRI